MSPDDYNADIGFSWSILSEDIELYKRADPLGPDFILNVKKYMCEHYKIEKSYIFGFSQGGIFAYVTGIKNPDEFEGIVCFGARLPDTQKYPWFLSEEDIEKGYQLKVFIGHGKTDRSPYKNATDAKRKLKKYNYEVESFLFDGGHKVDHEAFKKALSWMGIQQ